MPGEAAGGAASAFRQVKSNKTKIFAERDRRIENKYVHLGDSSNLSNKMLYVVAILEKEKENAGDIFVNGDLNNKFQPYFRQKV